jgi:hypothetical protein
LTSSLPIFAKFVKILVKIFAHELASSGNSTPPLFLAGKKLHAAASCVWSCCCSLPDAEKHCLLCRYAAVGYALASDGMQRQEGKDMSMSTGTYACAAVGEESPSHAVRSRPRPYHARPFHLMLSFWCLLSIVLQSYALAATSWACLVPKFF